MSPFQKKLLLSLGISLTILIFFIWLVVFPFIDKIKVVSQEYLINQKSLYKLDQGESLFNELESSYQEKQDDLLEIEGVLLSSEETAGFITTLEDIAQQTGNFFEIKSVSLSPLDKEEPFISLRIFLWGDFAGLLHFLASVEDSPYRPYRLIEIDSLNIRRSTGLTTGPAIGLVRGNLESVLNIKIYTQ